ncbi:MAG: hemolysin [Dehalococcoidia bacterium]|nr:hemolysin [Dehalococcoidia bacterium]
MSTYIFLILLFLAISAFISALEVAFLSLQRSRVKYLAQSGKANWKEVDLITQKPDRLLATTLLSNNLVQTAAATVGTIAAISLLGEKWGPVAATVGVAMATLLLAEAIPKTFAARHPEQLAPAFARLFRLLEGSLSPVVAAISWITSSVTGGRIVTPSYGVSEEEISALIEAGKGEGTVQPAKADMLQKVLEFTERPVREVQTPRTEVISLEIGTRLGDFLELYRHSPHSRYPVYRENVDSMTGILSIKDVLVAMAEGMTKEEAIDKLVRPIFIVPESKPLGELFAEMRDRNYHVAAVVDEYGGTSGMLTSSQLVEEIVGELGDEIAGRIKEFEVIDNRTFQIDGTMRIEDVNEQMKLSLPPGEYETVAGFVLSLLGRIPREGEQVKYHDIRIAIINMRGAKIEKVLVTKEDVAQAAP